MLSSLSPTLIVSSWIILPLINHRDLSALLLVGIRTQRLKLVNDLRKILYLHLSPFPLTLEDLIEELRLIRPVLSDTSATLHRMDVKLSDLDTRLSDVEHKIK